MLKRILFTLVFLSSFGMITAQEIEEEKSSTNNSKNTAYFELLGKGGIYSFNYEREVYRINEQLAFNASLGFSIMNGFTDIEKSKDRLFPLEINAKYSFGKHHVLLGFGSTLWKYKVLDIKIDNSNVGGDPASPTLVNRKEWYAHLTLDYRYQKPEGGLMLKAGITPLWFDKMSYSAFTKNANFQMWGNIGIGWGF